MNRTKSKVAAALAVACAALAVSACLCVPAFAGEVTLPDGTKVTVPDVPELPDTPELPDVPDVPNIPDVPATPTKAGDFEIATISGGVAITAYTGTAKAVVVPATINGAVVTTISRGAFEGNTAITSVQLPVSLTTIGDRAFARCSVLEQVNLPRDLASLGTGAFEDCPKLAKLTVACNGLRQGFSTQAGSFQGAGAGTNGMTVEFTEECVYVPRYFFTSTDAAYPKVRIIRASAATTVDALSFSGLTDYSVYAPLGSTAWAYAVQNHVPFVATGAAPTFSDVAAAAWYHNAVIDAANLGVISGYGTTGKFGPMDNLTRAQAAVILWRYFEPYAATTYDASKSYNNTRMVDVKRGMYYTGAANWAVEAGIITGRVQGNRVLFAPDDLITREELCTIMARAAAAYGHASGAAADTSALDNMPDGASVATWARENVAWALGAGVISGVADAAGNRSIAPQLAVNRATMATIVVNADAKGVIVR